MQLKLIQKKSGNIYEEIRVTRRENWYLASFGVVVLFLSSFTGVDLLKSTTCLHLNEFTMLDFLPDVKILC